MKKVSKIKNILLSMAVLSTASFAGDEFKVLPFFLDDDYKAHVEVAAVVGYMDFDRSKVDEGAVYGLELSFDCPVFTLPGDNLLRQQLNVNRYSENGLKITTIEMNPYYFIDLADDLSLGFGPGIGAMHADSDNAKDQWLFTVQAGAGLKYYIDKNILVGADIRYQWTAEKDVDGSGKHKDLDNMSLLMKVGYAF